MNKKIHRFIINFNKNGEIIEVKDKEFINQISRVLKLNLGELIVINKGNALDLVSKIVKIEKDKISLKLEKSIENKEKATRKISLYCAVLKNSNFELVAQKATEIGILEITPIITDRTIKTGLNYERVRKIMKEASEQSGRGTIPELKEVLSFEDAIDQARKEGFVALFDLSGRPFSSLGKNIDRISIFVGPEGGWTDEEVFMADKLGSSIISLGQLVLRAETAAIVASYLAANVV